MKEIYVRPQIEVLEIEVETVLMQGSYTGVKEGETSDTFDANNRRGSWGDLWE